MGRRQARGIYYHKVHKYWQSKITVDGKTTYLGTFKTEKDALDAYNKAKGQLPPQYVIHASDVELAWVAGIIDGEGCISVIKSKVNKKEGVYFRYQLNIYVGMIHKPTIYRIKDIFKELPKEWYEDVYSRAYWQFNCAIHPDLNLIGTILENDGNSVIVNWDNYKNLNDLYKYCIVCSYHLNFLVKIHYDWSVDSMKSD